VFQIECEAICPTTIAAYTLQKRCTKTNSIALQSASQSLHNRDTKAVQPLCDRYVNALQSLCNRCALDFKHGGSKIAEYTFQKCCTNVFAIV
jgi:hypothetical protein